MFCANAVCGHALSHKCVCVCVFASYAFQCLALVGGWVNMCVSLSVCVCVCVCVCVQKCMPGTVREFEAVFQRVPR